MGAELAGRYNISKLGHYFRVIGTDRALTADNLISREIGAIHNAHYVTKKMRQLATSQ